MVRRWQLTGFRLLADASTLSQKLERRPPGFGWLDSGFLSTLLEVTHEDASCSARAARWQL
jgi:hypothetical protein